jgi:anti-anti-sigma regulatory factor
MNITERQTTLGLLGLLTAGSMLSLIIIATSQPFSSIWIILIVTVLVCAGLLFFYWRGFEVIRPITAIFIAILTPITLIGQPVGGWVELSAFTAPAIALVLGGPSLVLVAATIAYGGLMILAGFPSAYTDPINLLIYVITIIAIILSRLVLDTTLRRSAAARADLVAKQQEVTATLALAEARAVELSAAFEKQRILAETVQQLGAPLLPVQHDVLVLPIIGHVDSERIERLTRILLDGVVARRARFVILDVTGLAYSDSSVIGPLIQATTAVELLGTTVLLAGISAEIAQLIVEQQISLGNLQTYGDLERAIAAVARARTA